MELIQHIVYVLALIYLILSIGLFLVIAFLLWYGYKTVREVRNKGESLMNAFIRVKKTQAVSAIMIPVIAFLLKKIGSSFSKDHRVDEDEE